MSIIEKLKEGRLINKNDKVSPWLERKITDDLRKDILAHTSFLSEDYSLIERIHIIRLNITKEPLCKVCSTKTNYHKSIGNFADTCSLKCASILSVPKRKTTNLDRYGVECNLQILDSYIKLQNSTKGAEKSRLSVLEKYGVDNVMKLSEVKKKHFENVSRGQREKYSIGEHYSQIHFSTEQLEILKNKEFLYREHIEKQIPITTLSKNYGFSLSYLHSILSEDYQIQKFNHSYEQREFTKKIADSFPNLNIIENDRNAIKPKEIDIFIPEHNFGIEYHGSYWHSTSSDKIDESHRNKFLLAKKNSIHLFQIFDREMKEKEDLILSMISNKIGSCKNRIFARKCQAKEIDKNSYRQFCADNHIQGWKAAKIMIGLYYAEELVSIMSFGDSRFSNKYEYEMIRACTKKWSLVIGGYSKMFKYFINKYSPSSIVTYADARFFDGGSYLALGFVYSHHSKPNYWYLSKNRTTLESRMKFQKHKLKNILEEYDENKTEKQNMLNNGYRIINDAGNLVYMWKRSLDLINTIRIAQPTTKRN
jgi:hypothetical protein